MAKSNAARRIDPVVENAPSTPPEDALEREFFERGDRVPAPEPPVYLPYESAIVPLLGVLVLVGLSLAVLS